MRRLLAGAVLAALLAAGAFWLGYGCAPRPAAPEIEKYRELRDSLERARPEWEDSMKALEQVRLHNAQLRAEMEQQEARHVREANRHRQEADSLERVAREAAADTTSPWYLVAVQRQLEAEEERLARLASDSALSATLDELRATERQLQQTAERLLAVERAMARADTALTRAEKEIKRARLEATVAKVGGVVLVLGGILLLVAN